MTVARRLAAIEDSLTPTQSVLRWLEEAHAYGSLQAFVEGTLDQEPDHWPANRLCREAERGARRAVSSRDLQQLDRAIRKARRETLFRFELVLRINVTTHDLLEKEELIRGMLAANLALLAGADAKARRGAEHREMLAQLVDLLFSRADELEAAGTARARAEQSYLDSRPALFPDVREAWDDQLRSTREVAAMGAGLCDADGVQPPDLDAIEERASTLLADLVEPAKMVALGKLGEGEAAARIATSWGRARLDRHTENVSDSPPQAPTL